MDTLNRRAFLRLTALSTAVAGAATLAAHTNSWSNMLIIPATHSLTMGMNVNLSPSTLASELDATIALGHTWIRYAGSEMDWTPANGLDTLKTACDLAHSRGLKVLNVCQGITAHLAKGGKAGHYAAKNPKAADQWGQWVGQCAQLSDATEVLNECNYYLTPTEAAELHVAARRHVTHGQLITCGLGPAGGLVSAPEKFLRYMDLAAPGLIASYDGIGWHPYCFPQNPGTVAQWNTCWKMRGIWQTYHKPIWKTEYGEPNGPAGNSQAMTEAAAVTHRTQYYAEFDSQTAAGVQYGPEFSYNIADHNDPSWAGYTGALRQDHTQKPVWATIYARGQQLA